MTTADEWQASEHTPARRGMLQFNCTLAPPNMFALLPGSRRRPLDPQEQAGLWESRGGGTNFAVVGKMVFWDTSK